MAERRPGHLETLKYLADNHVVVFGHVGHTLDGSHRYGTSQTAAAAVEIYMATRVVGKTQ